MTVFKHIIEKIQHYSTIIIHRHVKPDPDALGTQLGLAQLIRENFKKDVYCVGSQLDELSFIGRMDTISDDMYQQALVIIVDTANAPRIDDSRYQLGQFIIKIDHHPEVDNYAQLQYVDTSASSTSEIIVAFAKEMSLTISDDTARLLYIGIVGDTGRFLYENATPKTMAIIAFLRQFKFSASKIHYQMITKPLHIAKLNGYLLQHLEITPQGVAYSIISQDILKKFAAIDEHTSSLVAQPGTVEGVICWGIFVEQPSGIYRCRLRSKGPAIHHIAKQHDGGGHPMASGANAKDLNEVHCIINELNQVATQYIAKGVIHE
ncbi:MULTISPECIES: bifunctional oligoribonuclease/PAP phosphatase NrnA [unclassified Granulicatella]|uniref:DHH family phosphoesterase n=1 Tax=unclassified Granulicatella TaxID=2630493 RepID=UPI0010736044|nr:MULTISPECIES: bifunctional oligoribonuclease/PAP phosphatase NrnA [unclassified Granulicatella]MBF0779811.1 bifunctional oligoribonuclease/PAP phosphatase NrnA [Granulicatella sp. 19428wC4_WM01]TFU96112.1 bifunctional oligoribonuclease/PAP phosphatase NrnA [Granulicatella sp. WM01]